MMDQPSTPQNDTTDNSRPSGSSNPLNPPDPDGFRSAGRFGSSPSREIPGVDLNALNSANSLLTVKTSKGVSGRAVVVTALLAAVILVASFVVLKRKDDAMADTDSSRANIKASLSHSLLDSFQQKERTATEAKGLTTDDCIPSISEESRRLMSEIPTYANASRTLGPADAEVKIHLFTDFSCPMCAEFQA